MFEIIKKVINEGRYNLSDLLGKIYTLWVHGDLSEEQKDELVALAQEKAAFGNGLNILAKLEELDARVRALEIENDEEEPTDTYKEYEAGKWYYNGDKVSFEGKNYVCIAPVGQVCTWSPTEYPLYWSEN